MSRMQPAGPVIDAKAENPRTLRWAAGILLLIGLAALVASAAQSEIIDRLDFMVYAIVFLIMGFPLAFYAQALKKIAMLEQRVRELEQRPKT